MQDNRTATELTIMYKRGYKCENPLTNPLVAYMFIRSVWSPELFSLQSHFMAFFIDPNGKTLAYRPISTGDMCKITVDVRLIASLALQTLSTYVITAHSRPSGNLTPSDKDLALVKQLKDALKLLN